MLFMKEILASVIVPIYNVESYLDKCLQSLQDNSFDGLEILLVNDGSTDNSERIAKSYVEKNPTLFRLLSKKNGGLSSARNYGIEHASGKYLIFIDSDDFVTEDFSRLRDYLSSDVDFFVVGYTALFIDSSKVFDNKAEELEGEDILSSMEISSRRNSAWTKIVKKSFLLENDLWFHDGFAEDFNFTARAYIRARKIKKLNINYYQYIAQRAGSIMNTVKKQRFIDLINHAEDIMSEMGRCTLTKRQQRIIEQYVGFNLVSNFRRIKMLNKEDKKEMVRLLRTNYRLIKHQRPMFLKMFVLFGRIFGFGLAYRLV